jgi:hypothetical protein
MEPHPDDRLRDQLPIVSPNRRLYLQAMKGIAHKNHFTLHVHSFADVARRIEVDVNPLQQSILAREVDSNQSGIQRRRHHPEDHRPRKSSRNGILAIYVQRVTAPPSRP